jgi:diguanylate cyclase (GGDEF)-like protein
MGFDIIPFDKLLSELRQKRSLEDNLNLIAENMEKDLEFSSLGVFLKVPKSDIFSLKIGRKLSAAFGNNTIFTVGDPLITEMMNLELLDIKGPSQFMFEKDYSHLLISPISFGEELLGFTFIDKEIKSFAFEEITNFGIYTSLISLVTTLDKQIDLIDQHKDIYQSTRIYHPAAFKENAEVTFSVMQRYNRYLSIAIMKLSNHKSIIHTYGEKKTDEMMNTISSILQDSLRNSDIIGRLNNDTFAILLPETSAKNSLHTIQRLSDKISVLAFMKSSSLGWGISSKTDETESFEVLIKSAEEAAIKSSRKRKKEIVVV